MERLNVNKPLRVQAIYFKGNGKPLRDRIVWVAANFLVVARDENDTAPTWYNVDKVDRLEGVEQMKEQPPLRQGLAVYL